MRVSPTLRTTGALLAATFSLLLPAAARACGVCGSGDRFVAMDSVGVQSWRLSAELRLGSSRVGDNSADSAGTSPDSNNSSFLLRETQLDLGLGYGFYPGVSASLSLPLLLRQITPPSGADATDAGLGDIELRLSGLAFGLAAPRKLLLSGGLKLPTAGIATDALGDPLPAAVQPGTGSVSPFVGAAWIGIFGPWIGRVSATFYLPFQVIDGPHASTTFRVGTSIERRLLPELSTRLGVNTRLEASTESNGVDEPNSGGFVGYVMSEVAYRPRPETTLTLGLHVPVVQALRGDHTQGTIAALGFTQAL